MPILIPILIIAFVLVFGILAYFSNKQRREALAKFAAGMGMQFIDAPGDVHDQFFAFDPFGRGSRKSSRNLIQGRWSDLNWRIFDYTHTTGSGKNQSTHRVSVVSAQLPVRLAKMRIRPEGLFDRLSAAIGFDDLNFESEAFSRRFHVSSDDRKQAYDIIHPQMIEYLLSLPSHDYQFAGDQFVVATEGRLDAREIQQTMSAMSGVAQRIPGFVQRERAV
ncbi:MAG TPA: DUF3137 domain-containing protein [Tepidisphaeraceae bacterium]|nr:DUF3137 domain-containing protein [Tepidisphaeraceae bacterium]